MKLILSFLLAFALFATGGFSSGNVRFDKGHEAAESFRTDDVKVADAPTCCESVPERAAASCLCYLAYVPARLTVDDTVRRLRYRMGQARAPASVLPNILPDPPKA